MQHGVCTNKREKGLRTCYLLFLCECKHAFMLQQQRKSLGWTVLTCLIHMDFFRESKGKRVYVCVLSGTQGEIRQNPTFLLADFIVLCPLPPQLVSITLPVSVLPWCDAVIDSFLTLPSTKRWWCALLFFLSPSKCVSGMFVCSVRVSEPSSTAWLRMFVYCVVLACSPSLQQTVITGHHIDKRETKVRLMSVLSLSFPLFSLSPLSCFPWFPLLSSLCLLPLTTLRGPWWPADGGCDGLGSIR